MSVLERARTAVRDPLSLVRRLGSDDLLRHGGLLAGATVVSGGLNYGFQVFMGRALSPETYGVFGAVFALFYVASVLTHGIKFSTIRFTAATDPGSVVRANVHGGLLFRAFLAGLVAALALAAASPVVSPLLGASSVWPVVLVAVAIPFQFGFRGNLATFQGFQWFGCQAAYNTLYAGIKLALGVGLVLLGYDLHGAVAALSLGALVVGAVTTVHLRRRLGGWRVPLRDTALDYGRVYRYLWPSLLAGICLTVPANLDVIVVSAAFSGEAVGHYVAASVLGKVLIFLPMGISKAMFPKVTGEWTGSSARDEGEVAGADGLLDRALCYAALIAGGGALVYWLVPSLVLEAIFGAAYVAAAPLLRWYGLAIAFFVLAIVVLNFELARDRLRYVAVFAAASVLEVAFMWAFDGTMLGVVWVMLVANAGLFAFGIYETKL